MFGISVRPGLPRSDSGHDPGDARQLVDMHGVVKTFATPAGTFAALKGVDLHVGEGEFVSIVGKSGSGKSTLINMLTGIDRPSAGEVWVGGAAVHELNESQMASWRGRTLGVVFQFFQLLSTLTAVENVSLPMDFTRRLPARQRRERAMHLLELVGMADCAGELPSSLSGGQQQCVAIARALANDPPLIAADEPTGNLDSRAAAAVFGLFERLVGRGKTILVVTHDRELAARCRRTIVLADGQIVDDVRLGEPRGRIA